MKLNYKNIFKFLIALGLIGYTLYYFVFKDVESTNNKNTNNTKEEIKNKYSKDSIKEMNKLGIKDKVDLKHYSKTLDIALFDSSFDKDNIPYYENIKYFDNENIIKYINKLASDGNSINEINEIFSNYLSYKNFDINNAKRYLEYSFKNKDLSNQDIVTRVNLNLDKDYYTDTKKIDKPDIYSLVNKYNYLDINYVPDNLKPLFNISSLKMVDVAADAYEEFIKAAKNDGITLIGTTAYRSAAWQKELYDSYVNKDGKEKADTYSARPGYSEHQLGYSVDLNDPTFTGKRLTDEDYKWIKDNCYKYGFIIRFPENKESITGYMHENWHIRYVGKDIAKKINDLNITYDEYYDLYLK